MAVYRYVRNTPKAATLIVHSVPTRIDWVANRWRRWYGTHSRGRLHPALARLGTEVAVNQPAGEKRRGFSTGFKRGD